MKKRQISWVLVLALLMTVLSLGVFADADDSTDALHISKDLIPNEGGEYTLKLSSYAEGEIKHETVEEAVPTDFVLVLDQSGSMAYNFSEGSSTTKRVLALQKAAQSFVDSVVEKAEEDHVNHKIAVVGFSSDGYDNTEILTRRKALNSVSQSNGSTRYFPYGYNYNGTQYDDLTESDYKDALLDVTVTQDKTYIDNAIKGVTAYGGTQPQYGFYMAKGILDNRTEKTYKKADGSDGARNTVVIFFTDGKPGNDDEDDQIEAANTVVGAAKSLKDAGTVVYSIGVFSEGDNTPLTFTGTYILGCSDVRKYDSDWPTYYLRGNEHNNSAGFYNDTIADYMRCVSSEYPQAEKFFVKDGNESGNATVGASKRGSVHDTSKTYYFNVSNASALEDAFDKISEDTQSGSTSVTLDSHSVLKDVISTSVTLPADGLDELENGEYTYIKAYTVPCNGKDSSGYTFNENQKEELSSDNISVNGRTVSVSGFDYSDEENIVAKDNDRYYGKKLVVEISGLKPKNALRTSAESTNDEGSGIFASDSDTEPVKAFESPTFPANAFSVVEERVGSAGETLAPVETVYPAADYQTFDVTEHITGGFLYGGMYTDDSLREFVTDVSGKELPVTAGGKYYVKTVDPTYLTARNVYLTYYGNVIGSWAMAAVDENTYTEVGFLYTKDGTTKRIVSKDQKDTECTLYSSVQFPYLEGKPEGKTFVPDSIYSQTKQPVSTACIALGRLDDVANGTVQGYWITPDDVLVTADSIRTLANGMKVGEDASGYISAEKNTDDEVPSYQEDGLPVKAIFVSTDVDEEENVDADVKLAGYTTSLNGKIEMNFYMDLSDEVAADEDAYMQFTLPGSNHTEEVVKLSDAKKTVRGGKTYYVFSAGVAAKDMTSDIQAQFVKGDGTKSEVWIYTIKEYCDYVRNHTDDYDAESVALVENMLNYGGYAQTYFKYNTDKLANADLDLDLPEAVLDDSFAPMISGELEGLTYLGSSAMLTTATGLRHYFEFDGDAEDYTFTANSETLEVQSDKNGSYVLIDNIKAKDLPKAITLTVTDAEGNEYSLAYSVYSNIKQIVGNDDFDADAQNLMRALYGYGQAAKAYFASRS